MAREYDPLKLSSPQLFLWRMMIFLVIAGFVVLILYPRIVIAFLANPGLNGLIIGVLTMGILLAIQQVARLFPEVRWVNSFRRRDPGLANARQPRLLGPMAALLRDRSGPVEISPEVMRSILDSIGMRLDETRDITRYIGGLLVFLGLLGTFWGLTETVGAVGHTIQTLNFTGGNLSSAFEELKTGLAAPLGGMGISFSSSLFGLSGSLVIGFLDLQASQAQNRFYNELEDWLSNITELDLASGLSGENSLGTVESLRIAIERLSRIVADGAPGTSRASSNSALANIAEGIHGLVSHIRSEQQLFRRWMEDQSEEGRITRELIEQLLEERRLERTTERTNARLPDRAGE
ncbi:MAG: flagellar motor protein MotA [Ancalomicrobiaceae bacterium]|nr:flagellar motor protein MotA [Ancalomicrobiaceae bacterium]